LKKTDFNQKSFTTGFLKDEGSYQVTNFRETFGKKHGSNPIWGFKKTEIPFRRQPLSG
jgi:hypothetical protein